MPESASGGGTPSRFIFIRSICDSVLIVSFIYISLQVIIDYQKRGSAWKQGDWLINSAAGPIRRGPFGSAIISISDSVNLSPLLLVVVVQIAFLAVLFVSFRLLVAEIYNYKVSLLFTISPAIFTIFWVADPQGSVRKELLAFSAISIYAIGTVREKIFLLWVGATVFCLSVISHEAMVLFMPTFFFLVFFSEFDKITTLHAWSTLALVFLLSMFALFFAIENSRINDVSEICEALTDRGLSDAICGGAINSLTYKSSHGFEAIIPRLDIPSLGGFLISYVFALIPFSYIIFISERKILGVAVLILLAIPFAPLYLVAVDWGRWMSFHIFSATVVLICTILNNRLPINRTPFNHHLVLVLTLAILVSPLHTIGIIWGGAMRQAISEFWHFFT